jgi:hypothetical protein
MHRDAVFKSLPKSVQGDIDPVTGLPWKWVANLVGIAESGGRWDFTHGPNKASGAFQFMPGTELKVAQFLGLQTHHSDGTQIRMNERNPIEQEAMFRALWGSDESIPGVKRGPSNWSASKYPGKGGNYPHMWGARIDRIAAAPPEMREQVYRDILANDRHARLFDDSPQRASLPASAAAGAPVAAPGGDRTMTQQREGAPPFRQPAPVFTQQREARPFNRFSAPVYTQQREASPVSSGGPFYTEQRERSSLPTVPFAAAAPVVPRRRRERGLLPTGTPFVPSGSDRRGQEALEGIRRGAAATTPFLNEMLFGPERQSAFVGDATWAERFARDWGLSEQEFRTAVERAEEGRYGRAAGWGLLGLAGVVPIGGDIVQGIFKAGRTASNVAEAAADVARVSDAGVAARPLSNVQVTRENISPQVTEDVSSILGRTDENIPVGGSGASIDIPSYEVPGVGRVVVGADPAIRPEVAGRALIIPRAPLRVAEVSPGTPEAAALRETYIGAQRAYLEAGGRMTDIDILVFRAARGDTEAARILNQLADVGGRPVYPNPNPSDFSGLFIVHNTAFPPRVWPDGSVHMRPTGDIRINEQTGYVNTYNPETAPVILSGTPAQNSARVRRSNRGRSPGYIRNTNVFNNARQTLHFTVNSSVADAPLYGAWGNPHSIIAPLDAVLEANPGSLANLLRIDTYLVPAPGRPLVLPDASVVTERPGAQRGSARANLEAQIADIVRQRGGVVGSNSGEIVFRDPVDIRLNDLAERSGVRHGIHDMSPEELFEGGVMRSTFGSRVDDFPAIERTGGGFRGEGAILRPDRRLLLDSDAVRYANSSSSNFVDRLLSGDFFSGGTPRTPTAPYSGPRV